MLLQEKNLSAWLPHTSGFLQQEENISKSWTADAVTDMKLYRKAMGSVIIWWLAHLLELLWVKYWRESEELDANTRQEHTVMYPVDLMKVSISEIHRLAASNRKLINCDRRECKWSDQRAEASTQESQMPSQQYHGWKAYGRYGEACPVSYLELVCMKLVKSWRGRNWLHPLRRSCTRCLFWHLRIHKRDSRRQCARWQASPHGSRYVLNQI